MGASSSRCVALEPIIVCGMAHSGTTEVARVLGSPPGFRNYCSGREDHLLECDELLRRDAKALRSGIDAQERHGVETWVCKRPWLESDWEWCIEEFPDAIFCIVVRPFWGLWGSWNKPNSAGLDRGLVDCDPRHAWEVWDRHIRGAASLLANAQHAMMIDFTLFCARPESLGWAMAQQGIVAEWDYGSVDPTRL